MSWLGDVVKFENFNLGNQWGKLKKNPERAFIGAMDEAGTKVWNKAFDWTAPVTGIHRNYEPMTDYFGGASKDSYTKAQEQGINTKPGATMHNIAKAITAAYAGGYGASQLGAGAGAGGAIDSTAVAGGGSGGGGAFVPSAGSGANFGIDAGASYGLSGGSGAGADVYGGWSPSGSSPSGSPSTLSPSSSNPAAYNDPYAAQDVMQQARDTGAASGTPGAWDNGASSNGASGSMFNKQMLSQALRGMGGGGQQQQQPPLEIIEGQPAFMQQPEMQPIQSNPAELAMALRNQYGY
jgi:hypothetical protein